LAYRFHSKWIWICLAGCLFWISCGDIPRDNVLDPKNPDSMAPQKVMIEAFVNTNNSSSVNEYALQALDSLAVLYHDRIIIAEYHRNAGNNSDPYHLVKNESIYKNYVSQFDNVKGVPDIFINGTNHRVQGASSVSYSLFRLEAALVEEITKNSHFILEVNYTRQGTLIQPDVWLGRLGTQDINHILVKAVIVSYLNSPCLQRVVQSVVESQQIPSIAHGEHMRVDLSEMTINPDVVNTFIVYVTDADATTIYQCASQEIL